MIFLIILTILLAISFSYNLIYKDVIKTLQEDVDHYAKNYSDALKKEIVLTNKMNNLERRRQYKKKTL